MNRAWLLVGIIFLLPIFEDGSDYGASNRCYGDESYGCDSIACDSSACGCTSAKAIRQDVVLGMFGDGGLINPRLFTRTASGLQIVSQNHIYKVAENNTAVTQDRIGFNFNGLQDVYNGQDNRQINDDMYEYRFFVEKSLLDGLISLDFMLPFYTTSQREYSTAVALVSDAPQTDEVFGDLAFGVKAMLHRSCSSAISLGLRMEAPTADEIVAPPGAGIIYSSFDDDVWHFTPYAAALWTPTERFFAQSFLSYRLNSGSIHETEGLNRSIREQDYLMADLSAGYWLYRNRNRSGLTGLAPTLELHYTTTTNRESVSLGLQTVSDSVYGSTDQLNLTAGLTALFGNRISAGLALAAPLRDSPTSLSAATINTDQSYDWAILARLTYSFGR